MIEREKSGDMRENEKYYFDKYNLIKDADPKTCDGTGCCSTCMYRKWDQSFENDYCLLFKKGNINGTN